MVMDLDKNRYESFDDLMAETAQDESAADPGESFEDLMEDDTPEEHAAVPPAPQPGPESTGGVDPGDTRSDESDPGARSAGGSDKPRRKKKKKISFV